MPTHQEGCRRSPLPSPPDHPPTRDLPQKALSLRFYGVLWAGGPGSPALPANRIGSVAMLDSPDAGTAIALDALGKSQGPREVPVLGPVYKARQIKVYLMFETFICMDGVPFCLVRWNTVTSWQHPPYRTTWDRVLQHFNQTVTTKITTPPMIYTEGVMQRYNRNLAVALARMVGWNLDLPIPPVR
jgi:hypothetical protein